MKRIYFIGLFTALFFSACESSKMKTEAETQATQFFSYLKDGDEVKLKGIYKDFGKFETYYKSDSAYVKSSSYENDIATVVVNNRFTNGLGKSTVRDILLFFKKDSAGKFSIFDSKGLTDFTEKNEYIFGQKTGCILASDTTDQQIIIAMDKSQKVFIYKGVEVLSELQKDVYVTDWSWETLYSGSASGKGIVVNNSTFNIPKLGYTVTFKNSAGEPITSDKGTISYETLNAGDKVSFSFYTDYVGGATKASIDLNFDEDLILNYLASKEWTGKECEEYFKVHPDESTKK